MTMDRTALIDDARALVGEMIELCRRLHRRAEIGLLLLKTQRTVAQALAQLNIQIITGQSLSSVIAVLDGCAPGGAQWGRDCGGHGAACGGGTALSQ